MGFLSVPTSYEYTHHSTCFHGMDKVTFIGPKHLQKLKGKKATT